MDPHCCCNDCYCNDWLLAMQEVGKPVPYPYQRAEFQYQPSQLTPNQQPMPGTAVPPVQLPTPMSSYYVVYDLLPTMDQRQPFMMTLASTQPLPLPTTTGVMPSYQPPPLLGNGNASSVEIKLIDIPVPVKPRYDPLTVTVPIPAHDLPPGAPGQGRQCCNTGTNGPAPQTYAQAAAASTFKPTTGPEAPEAEAQGETIEGARGSRRVERRGPQEPSWRTAPPRPSRQRNQTESELTKLCKFCRSNNETWRFCCSHNLRDEEGKVSCPILRRHTCPGCGATGDFAHTLKYCPAGPRHPEGEEGRAGVYDCVRNAGGGFTVRKY